MLRIPFALIFFSFAFLSGGLAQPERPSAAGRMGGVMSFGNAVNSAYPEHCPLLSPDGRTLYFSRGACPQNIGMANADDIWVSYRQDDGTWSRAINVGAPINDQEENRMIAVNPAGTRFYFSSRPTTGVSPRQCYLFFVTRQGRSWNTPEAVEISDYFNGHPDGSFFFPSADESVLLMSAQRPGGLGQRDLYVSFRQPGGGWSAPTHLGPAINTAGDERRILLAADDRTLYFSSNGRGGQGGTDVFMCRRLDDSWTRWTEPVNLGSIVNTDGDDDHFSMAAAGTSLTFVRDTEEGRGDLFRANLPLALRPLPVVLVQGQVSSADPSVRLFCLRLGLEGKTVPEQIALRGDGRFRFIVPASVPAITVYVVSDSGFAASQSLPLAGKLPGGLDLDSVPVLPVLSQDGNYQKREEEIRQLHLQLRETERQLKGLLDMVNQYAGLSPLKLRSLDTLLVDSFALRTLAQQYQTYFLPAESGAETPEEKPLRSFEEFQRLAWRQLAKALMPEALREAEKEAIRLRLVELSQARRPDAFQRNFLEERFAALAADTTRYPMPVPLYEKGSWQWQLELELQVALADPVRRALQAALRQAAHEKLDHAMRYQRRALHYQNLAEALSNKLSAQMEAERGVMASLTLPELRPSADSTGNSQVFFREVQLNLAVLPLQPGLELPLNSLFFNANEAGILPASEAELQRLIDLLSTHPRLGLEIVAHTHEEVSHLSAQRITQERSAAVSSYLIGKGIAPERIRNRGSGKLELLVDGAQTESSRRQNQRLDIRWFYLP